MLWVRTRVTWPPIEGATAWGAGRVAWAEVAPGLASESLGVGARRGCPPPPEPTRPRASHCMPQAAQGKCFTRHRPPSSSRRTADGSDGSQQQQRLRAVLRCVLRVVPCVPENPSGSPTGPAPGEVFRLCSSSSQTHFVAWCEASWGRVESSDQKLEDPGSGSKSVSWAVYFLSEPAPLL